MNAGTTSDPTWAGALSDYRNASNGFLEALRPVSPFDAIAPFALNVPARRRIGVSTTALTGSIAGEGAPKPVTRLDIELNETEEVKALAFVVLSAELMRLTPLAAIAMIQRELAAGCAAAANGNFLTALVAAANTAGTIAAGSDFLVDLHDAVTAVNVRGSGKLFAVVPPAIAADLAMDERNAFNAMTVNGGTIRGVTILVHDTPDDGVVVVDAGSLSIDPGIVTLASAEAGALQMDSNPSGGAQNLVSLFQTNSFALRAERLISHKVLRDTATAVITAPDYSPVASP